jgi:sec-independent protein translocase protein TatC
MTPAVRTAKPLPPDDQDDDRGKGQMGFLEHLDELRTRIIRSLIAIAAGMAITYVFVDRIANFILAPALRSLPPGTTFIFTRPGEGFAFQLDVALIGGLVLAAPFVMYQVWRFIAPGLYSKEKKYVVPFVVLSMVGTFCGALFTHYLMFPATIAFFGTFDSRLIRFMPRIEDTFDLYKSMMIGMVLVFQMPTLVLFLAKLHLVTARFLWRNLQYAILIIFVLAAVLTSSPDWWNQTVFALPMIALYLISIVIAWIVGPKRERPLESSAPGRETSGHTDSTKLRLVIGAMAIDQARKHRRRGLRT